MRAVSSSYISSCTSSKGKHLLAVCIVTKESSVNPGCCGSAVGLGRPPQGATSCFQVRLQPGTHAQGTPSSQGLSQQQCCRQHCQRCGLDRDRQRPLARGDSKSLRRMPADQSGCGCCVCSKQPSYFKELLVCDTQFAGSEDWAGTVWPLCRLQSSKGTGECMTVGKRSDRGEQGA